MKPLIGLVLFALPSFALALECSFKSQSDLGRAVLAEINQTPIACSGQSVHLTFDDGPSPQVTPVLLNELRLRRIQASFFVTTTNLASTHPRYRDNRAMVLQTLNDGHLIANHGHDHSAYDLRMNASGQVLEQGLSESEREHQIEESIKLLNEATGNRFSRQPHQLFRLPYGRGAMPSAQELEQLERSGKMRFTSNVYSERLAQYRRQSPVLQTLGGSGMSHLGWNMDSGDSSYSAAMPNQQVLKDYILKNLKSMCSGPATQVALYHDIKLMNTAAIPVIADLGQCLGLKFISSEVMMQNRKALSDRGVLIEKREIERAPAQTIEDLLRMTSRTGTPAQDCPPEEEAKTCFSQQYNRSYKQCEGGDSVCLGGRWYSRRDPMVINNCSLND